MASGIPATHFVYPDEGHGFVRPENKVSFNAIAENFFAQYLGGRGEPIRADVQGFSLDVRAGVEPVPGLAQAMAAVRPRA